MPYCPSVQSSDTLCFLGVGIKGDDVARSEWETRFRSLFSTDAAIIAVQILPGKTYMTFDSIKTAEKVRQEWQGRVLPRRLSRHPVTVLFGQAYEAKINPEPENVLVDPLADTLTPATCLPKGLQLFMFLNEAEESVLLTLLDSKQWDKSGVTRRTQHYGAAAIDFRSRSLDTKRPTVPIPIQCRDLLARARRQQQACGVAWPSGPLADANASCLGRDQMTVNEYLPGDGIAAHIDAHSLFEDGLLIMSLGSAYVMDFREQRHSDLQDGEAGPRCSLLLPRRSLLVLQGEARYNWTHGLASRKTDKVNGRLVSRGRRVSLSFRRLRNGNPPFCECLFPASCDKRIPGK
jgi:alkylated DNA repair dioxygenase AlkB